MIHDFRKKTNVKNPVNINNLDISFAESYNYLGVTVQNDLKRDVHIEKQIKKAKKKNVPYKMHEEAESRQ